MNDSQRARLERAFETLRNQKITPILELTGSTGNDEDDWEHIIDIVLRSGTPRAWVADYVGTESTGGGYWDSDGILRYRYSDRPVQRLLFQFPATASAIALTQALAAEGFRTSWDGSSYSSVEVDMQHALDLAVAR